ncbi:dihydrofolate reductase family protein [Streptomyces sp. NPDC059814]|uniref:dihydrofolate reductase family protein n=1 Tax=Streptomyces sp. NPDC059814 TaxID=3346959 RepID=UPI00365831D8
MLTTCRLPDASSGSDEGPGRSPELHPTTTATSNTRPGKGRLLLSNREDFERVDSVHASVDAIPVGAGALRAGNPRLLVDSAERRASRVAVGRPEYPLKVTITATGDLDPCWKFWHHGGDMLVLVVGDEAAAEAHANLGDLAGVRSVAAEAVWPAALDILGHEYAVKRLMVEGGGTIHAQFLEAGLADELQLVIAPLLVGQPDAVRVLGPAAYPGGPAARRMPAGVGLGPPTRTFRPIPRPLTHSVASASQRHGGRKPWERTPRPPRSGSKRRSSAPRRSRRPSTR